MHTQSCNSHHNQVVKPLLLSALDNQWFGFFFLSCDIIPSFTIMPGILGWLQLWHQAAPLPSGNGFLASSETSYVHLRSVSTAVWHDVLIHLPHHLALGLYLLPFLISQASSFFLNIHCFKVLKDSPLELSNHIEAPGLMKWNEFMFQL